MNINISGEVVRTSQLPKRIIGLGDYLVALNSSPLETSTVLVSDFVSFLNTQFATSLASLTDVSINGPLVGQALVFNGSYWVNQNLVSSLAGLSDVTIASLNPDQLLRYDGTSWKNWTPTFYSLPAGGTTLQYIDGTGALQTFPTTLPTNTVKHQVKAGVPVTKGQAVYVTSADGTNMIVGLASNASESTSSKTMGLLDATVTTNGFANVVTEGLLAGLDTTGANAAGDPVWLGTGGNLIYGLLNKPYAPNHLVFIGIVTRRNANNGEIFVKVQNGFELDELHNVDAKNPNNNDGIFYNSTTQLWEHKQISAVAPTPTLDQVTTAGNTTTNAITVGGLNVDSGVLYVDPTNNRIGVNTTTPGFSIENLIPNISGGSNVGLFISDFNLSFAGSSSWLVWARRNDLLAMSSGIRALYLGNNGFEQGLAFHTASGGLGALTNIAGTEAMRITNTRNVLIGSTTDAGYKLDVAGSARIAQSTAGTKLTVTGIDQEDVLLVNWGGTNSIGLGSNTANNPVLRLGLVRFTAHPNGGRLQLSGATGRFGTDTELKLYGSISGTATGTMVWLGSNSDFSAAAHNPTSGTLNVVGVLQKAGPLYAAFNPTSGNATFNIFNIDPVINTTGTYAGIVRGIYYNPTLTSITGVTHRAIETTSGDVIFGAGNSKLILQENVATINNASTLSILFGQSTTAGYATGIFSTPSGSWNRGILTLAASPTGNNNYNVQVSDRNIVLTGTTTDLYKPTSINNKSLSFINNTGNTGNLSMYWDHGQAKVGLFSVASGSWGKGDFRIAVLNTTDATIVSTTHTRFMITGDTYNVLIGTTTDAGYKLDVNGTARFTGNVSLGSPNVNDKLEVYGNILIRANDRIRLAGTSDGNTAIYAASAVNITANVRQNGFGTFDVTFGALGSQTRVFRVNDHTGHANVVIGLNAVSSASAVLQADSTTQGFLPPRLTTAQILAIASPAEGLQVYNTDLKTICFYNGTAWQRVTATAM